jgi:membrane protein
MGVKYAWNVLRRTFSLWSDHEAPRVGAALAFYAMLSLAPLIIFALAIMSFVVGHSNAQNQLLEQVQSMVGAQGTEAVKATIEHGQKPAADRLASIIGVVTLLFGASGVFVELRSALDKMWSVKANAGGIWGTIKDRVFSFGVLLGIGFLLLVGLIVSVALAAMARYFDGSWSLPHHAINAINVGISIGGAAVLFALIFRFVPATRIPWRGAWIGAIVTAILFTAGKFLIGLYLTKTAVGSAYGAAGSLVVMIVWIYYSAMIFLLGAEFTCVISSPGGGSESRIAPSGPAQRAA